MGKGGGGKRWDGGGRWWGVRAGEGEGGGGETEMVRFAEGTTLLTVSRYLFLVNPMHLLRGLVLFCFHSKYSYSGPIPSSSSSPLSFSPPPFPPLIGHDRFSAAPSSLPSATSRKHNYSARLRYAFSHDLHGKLGAVMNGWEQRLLMAE